jgi:hypothetical protein
MCRTNRALVATYHLPLVTTIEECLMVSCDIPILTSQDLFIGIENARAGGGVE